MSAEFVRNQSVHWNVVPRGAGAAVASAGPATLAGRPASGAAMPWGNGRDPASSEYFTVTLRFDDWAAARRELLQALISVEQASGSDDDAASRRAAADPGRRPSVFVNLKVAAPERPTAAVSPPAEVDVRVDW